MPRIRKPAEGKSISKPEDKVWHEWYDKLSPEEHAKMLKNLGLDNEDIDEFKEEVFHETPKPKKKK